MFNHALKAVQIEPEGGQRRDVKTPMTFGSVGGNLPSPAFSDGLWVLTELEKPVPERKNPQKTQKPGIRTGYNAGYNPGYNPRVITLPALAKTRHFRETGLVQRRAQISK